MKSKKLLTIALCALGTLSFVNAQDAPKLPQEAGAAPAVATTGNFEQFPECRLYLATDMGNGSENKFFQFFKEISEKIDSMTSVAAFYDKNTAKFDTKQNAGPNVFYNLISWDGFIPIKKAGTYTFLVTWPSHSYRKGLGLLVNDKYGYTATFRADHLQLTLDVSMKPGMNKLRFIVGTESTRDLPQTAPMIRYKLMNAIGDFREFKPANLSHKVENEDW